MSADVATARKEARLDVRLPSDLKMLLEEAATLSGISTSAFVVETVMPRAREVVREYRSMELSVAESRAFVERLMDPVAPNEALREAAKRYWSRVEAPR